MPSLVGLGTGKIGSNSHPIHPVTVHMPIAFLTFASILDILTYTNMHTTLLTPLAKAFTSASSHTSLTYHLSLLSYTFNIIGLLTCLPALSTGLIEFYAMYSAHGLDLSNPKIKTTIVHAALNDLAIVGALYNWLSRSGVESWLPSGVNVGVSAMVFAVVGASGYLGGKLVYELGVGVQRMGEGKEIKDRFIEGEKEKARKEL